MPEGAENIAFYTRFRKSLAEYNQSHSQPLQGHLVIHPSNFATGTPGKDYTTLTVDSSRYSTTLEPPDHAYSIDQWDDLKSNSSKYKSCKYLLNSLHDGPVCVAIRGKLMAIAVGYHCLICHFGLEGHPIETQRTLYEKVTEHSIRGPNKNRSKAEKLRQYGISEFKVTGSHSSDDRVIRIMAAIVGDDRVWLFCDFARLMRLHVISRERLWTQEDLTPGSAEWEGLWSCFNGGPDWHSERDLVESGLRDIWGPMVRQNPDFWKLPIIEAMTEDKRSERFFSPFGRHLANDTLHLFGVFPTTPTFVVCSNIHLFDRFVNHLLAYMDTFMSPDYLKNCCSRNLGDNPFAFQLAANAKYDFAYMKVFRKAVVGVSRELYEALARTGLLDPTHIIGGDYVPTRQALLPLKSNSKTIRLPVYLRQKPADIYTVIRAQTPPLWTDGEEIDAKDHLLDGYKTTVGPANFRELKVNMPDVKQLDVFRKVGRPPKKGKSKTAGSVSREYNAKDLEIAVKRQTNILEESLRLREKYNVIFPSAKMTGNEEDLDILQGTRKRQYEEIDEAEKENSSLDSSKGQRRVRACRHS